MALKHVLAKLDLHVSPGGIVKGWSQNNTPTALDPPV